LTTNEKADVARDFTRQKLPWLVGAATLLLYLFTLNHWLTLASLTPVSKSLGWDWWTPTLEKPVFLLLTHPIRWLPQDWQFGALNFFSALCGALALALLARTVALLPHDRTREQRMRERSDFSLLSIRTNWLPPLFAVLVCGLQITFWEHATAATGEALDLLIFAYVIRCLLEFRLDQRDSWLKKLAFVYGLGITNSWAMIGFLPFFLVAVILLKGRAFFRMRFLLAPLALGFAGLLPYLWLPLTGSLEPDSANTFWQLLRAELTIQRNVILGFNKGRVLLLSLASVLPIIVIAIRWPSSAGDTSTAGAAIADFMFRLVHVLFFAVTVSVAFDPIFSPRELGLGLPFLTFYYLSALAAGYFSGYLLLMCGPVSEKAWHRPSLVVRFVSYLLYAAVLIAFVAVPIGLVWKNYPRISTQNSPMFKAFATQQAASLPSTPAIVLSDQPTHLLLAIAAKHGDLLPHLPVDARLLPQPAYHQKLHRRFSGRWPNVTTNTSLDVTIGDHELARLLIHLAQTNQLAYLHAPYGHRFLEALYLEPAGMVFRLKMHSANAVAPPSPSADLISTQDSFWKSALADQTSLLAGVALSNAAAVFVTANYSANLNSWAVQLQRSGHIEPAARWLETALALNQNNESARLNLKINTALKHSQSTAGLLKQEDAAKLFTKHRTWGSLLPAYGPVDVPELCAQLGAAYSQTSMLRQAAGEYIRAQQLDPGNYAVRLATAELFLRVALISEAIQTLKATRAEPLLRGQISTNEVPLLRLEALAHLQQTNFTAGESLLLTALRKNEKDELAHDALIEFYLTSGRITNALPLLQKQLQARPEHLRAMLNLGIAHLQLGAHKESIEYFDRLLKLQPDSGPALLNRAQAHFVAGQLDAAQRDFNRLAGLAPQLPAPHIGLAEIAFKQNKRAEAIKHYETGLKFTVAGSPEYNFALNRLAAIKTGTAK
jgi:tetratricopeptide (TPR) repeat protein